MSPIARLPVFLALAGKRAMLAGGSSAAAWKAELLSAAGAQVDVYAEEISAELRALADAPPRGSIMLHGRAWNAGDLGTAAVAIGAFADDADAARFAQAARKAGVPGQRHRQTGILRLRLRRDRQSLAPGHWNFHRRCRTCLRRAIRARLEMLAAEGLRRLGRGREALAFGRQGVEVNVPARCAFWRLFAKHAVTHAERADWG